MRDRERLPRALAKAGWAERPGRRRGHRVFRCPCGGHTVVLAVSPSDHRGRKNDLAHVRQCQGTWEEVAKWLA